MTKKSRVKEEFILNEPSVKIKNGSSRKSVKVSAKQFPVRVYRDKINHLLIMHDLHTQPKYRLGPQDFDMLKQIAFEGSISNNIPALRYNAIMQLAAFPTANALNTLAFLAGYGEDYYIRGHALQTLGKTGIELAIPIVAKSLNNQNIFISNAAQKAMIKLVKALGKERVQQYVKTDTGINYKLIEKIIESTPQKKIKKRAQTKSENAN